MNRSPSIVVIASTMRSGSTLLKALLAEAEDVLNLPETNFQNPKTVNHVLSRHGESDAPIKLLKKPAWYQESKRYPKLPHGHAVKTIALVRDVYDTVFSLRKMTFRSLAVPFSPLVTRWLAEVYWVNVTSHLLTLSKKNPDSVKLIRYEDLVQDPVTMTADLFRFIGSARTAGTSEYSRPDSYSWRWGSDDGSPNIKTLRVQPALKKTRDEPRLLRVINNSKRIVETRESLGYLDLRDQTD